MIPSFYLDDWRQQVPWINSSQVEQDLIISRALVNLYESPEVKKSLLFRGGTALHKIHFKPPARYSEDIDLVQYKPEPIGKTIDAIRQTLDHWLGEPKRKLTERSVKLIYYYTSEENRPMKLKIEINTTEHFHVLGLSEHEFEVQSPWFSGKTILGSYHLDELMATKLRALYQRRKGRDLFDLWLALKNNLINTAAVVEIFKAYCDHAKQIVSRAMFEKSLYEKSQHKDFPYDILELIVNRDSWSFEEANNMVKEQLVCLLPGAPWNVV